MLFGKKKELKPQHPNFDATNVNNGSVVVRDGAYINVIDKLQNADNHECFKHEIYDRNGGYLGGYAHDNVTGVVTVDNTYAESNGHFNPAFFAKEGSIYQRSELLAAGSYYDVTEIGQSNHTLERVGDGVKFTLETYDEPKLNHPSFNAQHDVKQTKNEIPSYMKGDIAKFMNEPSDSTPEGPNKDGLDF